MRRSWMMGAVAAAAMMVSAASAGAQARGGVPAAMRPPEGLCRVWVDGLAAGQQAGVSDCAYARAHVPAGGRVLRGAPVSARSYAMNQEYAPYYYGPKPVAMRGASHSAARRSAHAKAKRAG